MLIKLFSLSFLFSIMLLTSCSFLKKKDLSVDLDFKESNKITSEVEDCKLQFPLFERYMNKKPTYCEIIRGGQSLGNKIYLMRDEKGNDYTLRLLKSVTNSSTPEDRKIETDAFQVSSIVGAAPKLYYSNNEEGVLIYKNIKVKSYLENNRFNKKFVKSLAEKLRAMHSRKFIFRDKIVDRIVNKRLNQLNGDISEKDYKFMEKTLKSVQKNYMFEEDNSAVHRDMVHNILFSTDDEAFLIDFESASYDNKYYDLVSALLFFCTDKEEQEAFLRYYFKRKPTAVEYAKIETMKPVVLIYTAIRLYINYLKYDDKTKVEVRKNAKNITFEEMLLDRRKTGKFRIYEAIDLYEGFYGLLNEVKKNIKSAEYKKSKQILKNYKKSLKVKKIKNVK